MKRILIWGDTQTGKTTLVSCAFYAAAPRPRGIDRQKSEAAMQSRLWSNFERLRLGRHVGGTAAPIDIELVDDRGEPLVIEDIHGGLVRDITREDARARLANADAILVPVEWETREVARQFNAILAAQDVLRTKPSALVFTKCDRHLASDDPLWSAGGAWWTDVPWLTLHGAAVDVFGDSVWLSSAVGYHDETGDPAILLGEFGELIPWNVRPRGVAEPFEYLLDALRVTGGSPSQ